MDGIYRGGYGRPGRSRADTRTARAPFEVISFRLPDTKPHLIAVRYANFDQVFPGFIGFQAWIGEYNGLVIHSQQSKSLFRYMYLSVAAQLSLALLHLFLFLFYPSRKVNLYYVLFTVFFAGTNWAVATENLACTAQGQLAAVITFWICAIFCTTAGWYLLRSIGNSKIPRWKTITVAIFTVFYLLEQFFFRDSLSVDGFSLAFLLIMLDGLWALLRVARNGQQYSWIVAIGMMIIVALYFFVGADVFGLWTNYAMRCFVMSMGLLAFPVCFAIYLALDFARTNQLLSVRLAEVETLSAQTRAQEAEKLALVTQQAEKLEETVAERTRQVRRQAEQLQELDQVKSRFFVNLTHEFRTPLTLILGPAEQIVSGTTDPLLLENARIISRNAGRLLQLINQLLDLSRLEAGKMELNNTSVELVSLIRRNVLLFQSFAEQKQIRLHFSAAWDRLYVNIDQAKLESILYNLLSNAVKFTSEEGHINVELSNRGKMFGLLVKDTGIGIPDSKLPYIFDRFYQVDASDTRAQEGSGIGLAITKELTELMGGQLLVHSIHGRGTQVEAVFPIVEAVAPAREEYNYETIEEATLAGNTSSETSDSEQSLPMVLLIEDNYELRQFIVGVMRRNYQVIEATNGEEGLTIAWERIPDLIITDLMMPLMNGYQVCANLKGSEKTSHIPVVILTAKGDTSSRIAGLETRADAYISKPFDHRELLVTVANLIELRRQLQKRYRQGKLWLTDAPAIPSMEQVFLDKVKSAVEAQLDNEQYGVDQLSADVGLSRTQLHRKLKALTGQGPGELIRAVRLQRAYLLLKQRSGTVAEVGYRVGFGNANNFSTSFSKYFGFPPSEAANH